MSFLKKMRDRMFRSSDKIGEGLDALVADAPAETHDPAAGAAGAASRDPVAGVAAAAQPAAPRDPLPGPLPEPRTEPVATAPRPAPLPPLVLKPAPQAQAPAPPQPAPPQPSPPQPVPPAAARPAPPPYAAPRAPAPQPAAPQATAPRPQAPQAPVPQAPVPQAPAARPPLAAPPAPAPNLVQTPGAAARPEEPRPGFLGRLLGESAETARREMDDAMLERLEELLIEADMGVDTAARVAANISEGRFGKRISSRELREALATEIARIMTPVARPLPLYPSRPQVVLVVGVNGSGKTTTIGKLASQFKAAGKSVVIAAGDTFRAAAVEQLQVWGQRAGVPVLTAPEGSDPASLAFDAMTQAQASGADLLMIDTAGRLQNRADLMEELSKIVRVIRKKDPKAPHNTLLVLDASTGQNALNQVEIFLKLADVTGLVMTKLDGTAKGGVLVALADRFGLPIHAIGVGEQIDDLDAFDPEDFARALVGLDD
ncbi:signal recognition particle-docking protein FtsY [Paracoccaceae bacterium Fryx2]|nr:signal recognition particle-docking protein FtsY [Paracoccaceae bacterium Fryx2]